YKPLGFFGHSIIIADGQEWKKHRKFTAASFSERNNRLDWDETIRTVNDLIESWGTKSEIVVEYGVNITLPVS
ncbi:hypothetical protein M422DRAFT_134986, partial [Sphaerobolus stellatus SS14]